MMFFRRENRGETLLAPRPAENVSIEALRSNADDSSPEEFTEILESLLDGQVQQLHMRVGLVPNYFMTRGEALTAREAFSSFAAFGRKAAEKTFKLFHQHDFREEQLYSEFENVMKIIYEAKIRQDSSFKNAVTEVLNRQCYDKHSDSLLQVLVKRRHLKFLRTLLLYAGDLLNLDQCNRKGYSSLDLAYDRLEVEMVYLLCLYGASVSSARTTAKTSLGYATWIFYDLTVNLDTGRWLHKQSEQAIMERIQEALSPPLRKSLLEWTWGEVMSNETLKQLGSIPRLFTVVLADGCDAITNHEAWATLIRHLSLLCENSSPRYQSLTENRESRTTFGDAGVQMTACNDLFDFLRNQGADTSKFRTAGRTVFFECDGGNEIAVKLSKSLEDDKIPHPLAKEATMNNMIAEFKQNHGLSSEYPVTVQLLRLTHVPKEIREAIADQQTKGFHPFDLSADADGVTALVYRPPANYGVYVNDPSLPLDVCTSGLAKASYDAAVLARAGFYHGALVDIQHDSSREQRPHLWSFESFLTRFRGGAGRIEKGFAGLGAPNVRASGLADLKHLLTEEQVAQRYAPDVIHAQHNILYSDQERHLVALLEQLGASVFATALLVASSWQARHVQGVPSSENLDLELELENCFVNFLRGYLQVDGSTAKALLRLVGTDFVSTAAQIRMFATDDYVRIAETAPRRPVFGFFAKLLGFLTHPTAFVHFMQRGSADLVSEDRSLPEMRAVYGGSSETVYPRVDTSMMRCSPTWKRKSGWVNSKGQAHLGPYEGVLPFQTLIRDLYVVVYLSYLVRRRGKESFALFSLK
jgi:hypothetical protein